jgi:hypothetical protein
MSLRRVHESVNIAEGCGFFPDGRIRFQKTPSGLLQSIEKTAE